MATNTYVALKTTTLVGSTPSVTLDNIPQGYTDLVLVSTLNRTTINTGSIGMRIKFNGDSGSNYSYTRVYSAPASDRGSNQNYISPWNANDPNFGMVNLINIQNYSNSTTYKTVIGRASAGDSNGYVYGNVALWRNTAPITSIEITAAENFISGSVVLYGIAAEGGLAKATGGAIYSDANYWYHAFGASGTFTPTQSLTADILVVAGGGGGGASTPYNGAGGGGAGGILAYSSQSLTATGYTVTVGGGGASNTNGVNSQFAALTASVGGGKGGSGNAVNGSSGGSGGGAGSNASGGSATSGQGYAGGSSAYNSAGAGGGGAGGVGSNVAGAGQGGNGGAGLSTWSSWTTVTGSGVNGYFGGGGGGGSYTGYNVATGTNGGGNGGVDAAGSNAIANTGSGGGGGGNSGSSYAGGQGGSGIVIVRYAK